jgi:MFS superfamily sulfate permease-like transporter
MVLRVESGLFFGNAEFVRDAVRRHIEPDTGAIVLDAETVPSIDVSAARMLGALAADLERDGVVLVIARDVGQVRDVLRRTDAGPDAVRTFPTVQAAVEAVSRPGGLDAGPPERRIAPHPSG